MHFYDQVTVPELYEICSARRGDVAAMLDRILAWIDRDSSSVGTTP